MNRPRRRDQSGYVAIMTIICCTLLFGMAAFAADVGRWYVMTKQTQRAADAAALAGVPYLPGDQAGAFAAAEKFAKRNGFDKADPGVTVLPQIDSTPTRLRVSVAGTVPSLFGGLLGIKKAKIVRSAVADYAGPVPLGSPCNEYGNDPEAGGNRSTNCTGTGQYWGNIGSPLAAKNSGDAYQDGCANAVSGTDKCVGGVNQDYDPDGYFYTVTLTKPVSDLAIEIYDPALVHVGDLCEDNTNSKLSTAKALPSSKTAVSNPSTRYADGASSAYCSGDIAYANKNTGFTDQMATKVTVRNPGPNSWDPLSFPVNTSCSGTGVYPGFAGDLSKSLDTTNAAYNAKPDQTKPGLTSVARNAGYVAAVFRRWVRICTITNAPAGVYMVQLNSNGLGFDQGNAHNRFAIRAFSTSSSSAKDAIAVSGFEKMAMYANLPSATSTFYLARVPSGAAGQLLNVNLFDVGDSTTAGKIKVLPPAGSGVSEFTNCQATGAFTGVLPTCQLTNVQSAYNGKWETVSVQIPAAYSCNDLVLTACWVRLQYEYGSGQPSDTTSWTASIEGDPVRLIE